MSFGFKCPMCGSSHFGSTVSNTVITERHCHGYFTSGRPCTFTWGVFDDAKYGLTPVLYAQEDAIGVMVVPVELAD